MQNKMIARAAELLTSGTVDRVLGWKKGEFEWDVSPAVFTSVEELRESFVYNRFCGANLSKYLVAECRKGGRIAVLLKQCDSYSFNQLVKEHRISRDMCHVIGVYCDGMYSPESYLKNPEKAAMENRCAHCRYDSHAVSDEVLGEKPAVVCPSDLRFNEVGQLESMTPEERFAFWQSELSRCIRCNACRNACPACTCESCVFDNPDSGMAQKAAADSFEEKLFHIVRAFHVAGRCTDCGECSRVCPEHIPLHLLNRKFIKDINTFYGDYQAGETADGRTPLTDFRQTDIEPSEAVGGVRHA